MQSTAAWHIVYVHVLALSSFFLPTPVGQEWSFHCTGASGVKGRRSMKKIPKKHSSPWGHHQVCKKQEALWTLSDSSIWTGRGEVLKAGEGSKGLGDVRPFPTQRTFWGRGDRRSSCPAGWGRRRASGSPASLWRPQGTRGGRGSAGCCTTVRGALGPLTAEEGWGSWRADGAGPPPATST